MDSLIHPSDFFLNKENKKAAKKRQREHENKACTFSPLRSKKVCRGFGKENLHLTF